MCNACNVYLPISASCDYWRWGSGGRQESINAICILALNIINDKVMLNQLFSDRFVLSEVGVKIHMLLKCYILVKDLF